VTLAAVTLAAVAPPAPEEVAAMQSAVLDWYAANARDLAFRRTSDPWSVLVSEVIAQQTQASRAAAAWERFIAEFPTPAALAAASPAAAIRAWRGLGYNRRAVALRAAAIAIVDEHGGRVPDDYEALTRLPGIGPYTARAVLAIAFDRPVAALDTNIRRVVGRAFLGGEDALPPGRLQAAADGFVPPTRAATWTHALMDVGAAFCRKREPRCEACPLATHCRYRLAGKPAPALTRGSKPAATFRSTTRWLRGRILDRLRDAPDGEWVLFAGALGDHDGGRVASEVRNLHHEGLLEMDPAGRGARLRTGT
jgi:A/G-specific adenine glycosylase